jgi:hypothetical protein
MDSFCGCVLAPTIKKKISLVYDTMEKMHANTTAMAQECTTDQYNLDEILDYIESRLDIFLEHNSLCLYVM